jgi:hypothetical protein
MSKNQKIKSIRSLHESAFQEGISQILEVSSKSENILGVELSAFNLMIHTKTKTYSVESAFQGSKVFEQGGPFLDLLDKSSLEAKKDPRLNQSGRLVKFIFYEREYPLVPKSFFYDWLYINAVYKNFNKYKEIVNYDGFTDIEFNPKKSINCQAYSAALLVSLHKFNVLELALTNTQSFLKILKKEYNYNQKCIGEQKKMFLN